jgi:hypothetical protein
MLFYSFEFMTFRIAFSILVHVFFSISMDSFSVLVHAFYYFEFMSFRISFSILVHAFFSVSMDSFLVLVHAFYSFEFMSFIRNKYSITELVFLFTYGGGKKKGKKILLMFVT